MTQPPLPLGPSIEPITPATTLRDAWLSRRNVCLQLEGCLIPMVVGHVSNVAVTGTWATVDGWHVPLERVREITSPTLADVEAYAHVMHDLRKRVGKGEQ